MLKIHQYSPDFEGSFSILEARKTVSEQRYLRSYAPSIVEKYTKIPNYIGGGPPPPIGGGPGGPGGGAMAA